MIERRYEEYSQWRRLLISIACLVTILSILSPAAIAQAAAFKRHQWSVGNKCERCHIGDASIKYRHAPTTFFAGKHGKVKCVRCHANNKFALTRSKCWSCHTKTHGPKITRGCKNCHSVAAWRPARPKHKNKLSAKHNKLRCPACHKNNRYAGLTWACSSCHTAPHRSSYGKTCRSCHVQIAWNQVSMNHTAVSGACSSCHSGPSGHPTSACSQCHSTSGDWDADLFTHPSIDEHKSTSFACSKCHPSGYAGYSCLSCHDSNNPD